MSIPKSPHRPVCESVINVLDRCAGITDAGVAALAAGNPELEVLRLDGCGRLTDVGLAAVAESCRRLRVCLRLYLLLCCPVLCARVHDGSRSTVYGYGSMVKAGVKLHRSVGSILWHLPQTQPAHGGSSHLLQTLASRTHNTHVQEVPKLMRPCHARAQVLSLRECWRVSDEAVAAVAQHGSLESLDVSAVSDVGPATVKALATCCK